MSSATAVSSRRDMSYDATMCAKATGGIHQSRRDFLLKHKKTKDFPLESIHLCVFTAVDVAIVKGIMEDNFK